MSLQHAAYFTEVLLLIVELGLPSRQLNHNLVQALAKCVFMELAVQGI